MQTYLALSGLLNAVVSLSLGIIVLSKNSRKAAHILYFLFTVAIAVWGTSYFFWMREMTDRETALFWTRALTVGSIFMPVFHVHWILVNLKLEKKNRLLIIATYAFAFTYLLFSFSPVMVEDVAPFRNVLPFWPQPGWLYHFFVAQVLLSGVYSVYLLVAKYRATQGMQKLKIRYLLLASFFGYFSGGSNFPLWYGIPFVPVTNILFSLFPVFIGYSIVKHHLMDIRLALKRSTVLLASVGTTLLFIISIKYLSKMLTFYNGFWIDILLVLASVSIYPFIKNFFLGLSNKYFFSSRYNVQDLVSELSANISTTLEIGEIYKSIYETFYAAFYPKHFSILLKKKSRERFGIMYSSGLNMAGQRLLNKHTNSLAGSAKKKKLLFIDEMLISAEGEEKTILQELKDINLSLLLLFYYEGEVLGAVALGDKESGEIYNDEDIAVFDIISPQIAISVKNALLHHDSLSYADRLNVEKNKISSILTNFIDPIIFIDKKNCLRIFNPSAQRIFGIRKQDIGKDISRISLIKENLRSIISSKAVQKSDNKKSMAGHKEIFVEQEGRQRYFKAMSTPVLNEQNESIGSLKIFYDLTKEKELDRSKSEFITIAAHKLRTPLTSIKWIFELLLKNEAGEVPAEQKHYLEMGHESNEILIDTVNELLNASDIEGGDYELELAGCNMEEILREIPESIDSLLKEKKIAMHYEIMENMPLVQADKEKLSMAINGIIANAAHYTSKGGQIRVKAAAENGSLVITVKDNGIGIPEADKSHIFSKFYRSENALRIHTEGSGLGLFIAKNIIKMHQGEITFESETGKGTEFMIKLPISF